VADPFPDTGKGRLRARPDTQGSAGSRQCANRLNPAGFLAHKFLVTAFYTYPELGFGQLCGVAERMDDAVAEGGAEFSRLDCTPGREETLLPPELAPNRGERVNEGRPLLAVPGGS